MSVKVTIEATPPDQLNVTWDREQSWLALKMLEAAIDVVKTEQARAEAQGFTRAVTAAPAAALNRLNGLLRQGG